MARTNCQSDYFKQENGKLLCVVCGESASKHKAETKARTARNKSRAKTKTK